MEVWFLFCSMSLCLLSTYNVHVRTLTLDSCVHARVCVCLRTHENEREREIESTSFVCVFFCWWFGWIALYCAILYAALYWLVFQCYVRQLFCLLFAYFILSLSFYSSLYSFRILVCVENSFFLLPFSLFHGLWTGIRALYAAHSKKMWQCYLFRLCLLLFGFGHTLNHSVCYSGIWSMVRYRISWFGALHRTKMSCSRCFFSRSLAFHLGKQKRTSDFISTHLVFSPPSHFHILW